MKITSFNKDVENISKLGDRPNIENGFTSAELKALFDKAGNDIKEYINSILIEELASVMHENSGADKIGSGEIETLVGETVQEKLQHLALQVQDIANATIPDGTLTPDKFSPEIADFLTSASIRNKVYSGAGNYTFTVERAGTYKITLVGAGGGGGVNRSNAAFSLGGGGGASAVLWIDLKAGDLCDFTVGKGGEGLKFENNAFIAHAKEGGNTVFSLNGSLIATAEGGKVEVKKTASATGGDINISGGYAQAGGIRASSSVEVEFSLGGNTPLGNGGAFKGDIAGIGGGGFCGRYMGTYYLPGDNGGDGAVIIEFVK